MMYRQRLFIEYKDKLLELYHKAQSKKVGNNEKNGGAIDRYVYMYVRICICTTHTYMCGILV